MEGRNLQLPDCGVFTLARLYILAGFILIFLKMQMDGDLNKYINVKYAYLPISAIVLLSLLFIFEAARFYVKEQKRNQSAAQIQVAAQGELSFSGSGQHGQTPEHGHGHEHVSEHGHDSEHEHISEHDHHHSHELHAGHERTPVMKAEHGKHEHGHSHGHSSVHHAEQAHSHDHFGHSHAETSRLKRNLAYLVLLVPIITGVFLPVETLDSSFVKAKGFSFPSLDVSSDNPGFHQFLKPDTSVFYGKANYKKVSQKELSQFTGQDELQLNDKNFLEGLESVYNYPGDFMGKTIGFNGFIYKGEQTQEEDYFVFRFGFIHCVADSGVFGMLVEFPKGTAFSDDEWVHVTGTLASEMYQPFKETIPVLKVEQWKKIDAPDDPYVYRTF